MSLENNIDIINLTSEKISSYMKNDWIKEFIESSYQEINEEKYYVSDVWLLKNKAKRALWDLIYTPQIQMEKKSILDVGGGYSVLSKKFAERNKYTLIDPLYHEVSRSDQIDLLMKQDQQIRINGDWYHYLSNNEECYDTIVANDVFPNVDQRFLDFLAITKQRFSKLILSLTYFENLNWYLTKRVNLEEHITVRSWRDIDIFRVISDLYDCSFDQYIIQTKSPDENFFFNKRKIMICRIEG